MICKSSDFDNVPALIMATSTTDWASKRQQAIYINAAHKVLITDYGWFHIRAKVIELITMLAETFVTSQRELN